MGNCFNSSFNSWFSPRSSCTSPFNCLFSWISCNTKSCIVFNESIAVAAAVSALGGVTIVAVADVAIGGTIVVGAAVVIGVS